MLFSDTANTVQSSFDESSFSEMQFVMLLKTAHSIRQGETVFMEITLNNLARTS